MDFFADSITPPATSTMSKELFSQPATTTTARELFAQPATGHRWDGLDLNSQIASDFPNFESHHDYIQSPAVNNNEADNVARQSTTSKRSRGAGGKRAAAVTDPTATMARPFRVPRTADSSMRGGHGVSRAMTGGRAWFAGNRGGTNGDDGTSWQADEAPRSAARSGGRSTGANTGGGSSWQANAATGANTGGGSSWQANAAAGDVATNGGRARLAAKIGGGTSWQAEAAPGLDDEDETLGNELSMDFLSSDIQDESIEFTRKVIDMNKRYGAFSSIFGMYYSETFMDKSEMREPEQSGYDWVMNTLNNPTACFNNFRMNKKLFDKLHDLLVSSYGLRPTKKMETVEALAMFLL